MFVVCCLVFIFDSPLAHTTLLSTLQRKETENSRYSEKREGCHSGEFSFPVVLFMLISALNQIISCSVFTLAYIFCSFFSQQLCLPDYSVCDEHFNTPCPASQPRGPVQNRIHQKHSTSLGLWLFTGKMWIWVCVFLQESWTGMCFFCSCVCVGVG